METLQIKIILERSNPSLVREFTIPAEYTFSQLHQVICIALAWPQQESFRMWSQGTELQPEEKLAVLSDAVFYYECKDPNLWVFRGRVTGRMELEETLPQVVRYRGENPPIELMAIRDVNRQLTTWSRDGLGYYYGYSRKYPIENYKFSTVQINRLLRKRFSGRTQECSVNLNYQSAVSVSKILKTTTLEEIKGIARGLQIKMPSNLRKNTYITMLAEELAKAEPLGKFLEGITSAEYRLFQKVCQGKAKWTDGQGMPSLLERLARIGYVGTPYYNFYVAEAEYSREMLIAYEEWLDSGDEKEYKTRAELRTLLAGAVRLYGILEKDLWLKLVKKLLPEYAVTEETEKIWYDFEITGLQYGILALPEGIYYDTYALTKQEASELRAYKAKVSRYVPKMVMFEKAVLQDICFEGADGERLEKELLYCGVYREHAFSLNREIYKWFRQGKTAAEAMNALSGRLKTKNRASLAKLERELSALRPQVRQFKLLGHTQKETERLCIR